MFSFLRDLAEQLGPIDHGQRPVLAQTQAAAATRIRHVAWLVERVAEIVETDPRNDALLDLLDTSLAQAIDLAGQALAAFRETRDCLGRG